MTVGPVDGQPNRHARRLSQQTAFDTVFGPIRGIGPAFFPRQAGPWSLRRPLTARTSQYLSIGRILEDRRPRASQKRRHAPIAESDHGQYCWDRCPSRSTRSIGSRFAAQRRLHPGMLGRQPWGDLPRTCEYSHAWVTTVRSSPIVRLKHDSDSWSSLISDRGVHASGVSIGQSRVIRIGSYGRNFNPFAESLRHRALCYHRRRQATVAAARAIIVRVAGSGTAKTYRS